MRPLRLLQQQHHSKLCLITLLGLVLYTISLNCTETIILTPKDFSKIKIRFDFAQPDDSPPTTRADSSPVKVSTSQRFDQELVTSVLNEKLLKLQACLQQQHQQPSPAASAENGATAGGKTSSRSTAAPSAATSPSSATFSGDVFIESFSVVAHRADQYSINASLDTIQVSGVSHFTTADIASNGKSRKVSALLRFPDIRISLYYKVSGQRVEDKERQLYSSYVDKGKITYAVHGWRTALSGKVVNIVNRTRLELAGFGMRSHYDFFETTIESFVHGGPDHHKGAGAGGAPIDISKHISKDLLKKVINAVDDRLESTVLEQLDVHEMATWSNFRDAEYEREEDGHLLMMESKVHEEQTSSSSRRRGGPGAGQSRRKRQVPCEVGEELDEYVDSLFRFVKRLVRVMEPFMLPNVTIELEEYNLQIFLHSCGATRAYTFERKKPAWVLCQNETTTLGLTVGIEEARVHCKYRVIQDWRLLFDGDMEAQIRRPKAQVQITQLNPPENDEESESDDEDAPQVQQRIDKLKVWKPGQIVVLIRGLGNLSSALSMIINQMLSDTSTIDPIIEMIETDGVVAANDLLRNVSIPIFSII